jgi:hypothetical protein
MECKCLSDFINKTVAYQVPNGWIVKSKQEDKVLFNVDVMDANSIYTAKEFAYLKLYIW